MGELESIQTGRTWQFRFMRDSLRQHHARKRTLDEMVSFVGQLPANDSQTRLQVAGAEAARLCAVELQRLDPAVFDPAIDGAVLGGREPDELAAQIRCPTHLLAAQAEFGGVMDTQDVARFTAHAPHATAAVLAGVGHSIHQERPDAFVQALQRFVAAVPTEG